MGSHCLNSFLPIVVEIVLLLFAQEAKGHGRMVDPPARGSAGRYGFNVPVDYNFDLQLNCGGFYVSTLRLNRWSLSLSLLSLSLSLLERIKGHLLF